MTAQYKSVLALMLLFSVSLVAETDKYWFFFKDKGAVGSAELSKAANALSERALQRRAKVMSEPTDLTDVPVHAPYLDQLKAHGVEPVVISNWLNAVSAQATPTQIAEVRVLPFIERIQPVGRGRRSPVPEEDALRKTAGIEESFVLDYGASFSQNAIIRVPEVHAFGLTGRGVIIAVMDAGFSLKHPVFSQMQVLATRDFINDDDNVDDEAGDPIGQATHGTKVLSMLGGYAPGNLIGPAFGASFLLAKTEDISSETPIEEDYWIAAAEWAEALGADVFNTSLGYIDWYTYEDMNGVTAPITVAADLAVQKGVVVVTSAGNEGNSSWYYVSAPADGFHVIAVGAVRADSLIAGFSSRGPTSDGRIKPDVVAMGVSNVHANPGGVGYGTGNGTSYSSPMVAGASALILEAHPELTPRQVRQALTQTADRAKSPDNTYGFGLINTLAAVNYWGTIGDPAEENRLVGIAPNPFSFRAHSRIRFIIDLKELTRVGIAIYNILGQRVGHVAEIELPGNRNSSLFWDGRTPAGTALPSGVYFARVRIGDRQQVVKLTILP